MYVKLLNLFQSVNATGAAAAIEDHDRRLIADMGLDGPAAAEAPEPGRASVPAEATDVPGIADTALTYAPVMRLAL